MAMVSCAECGGAVSTNARVCPHCGYSAADEHCSTCCSFNGECLECRFCEKGSTDTACPHYVYDDYDDY